MKRKTSESLNEKGKVIVLRQTGKAGEPEGKSPVAVIVPIAA